MRVSVCVSVLVAVGILVLGVSQVMAEQCYICGRTVTTSSTTVPASAVMAAPSCANITAVALAPRPVIVQRVAPCPAPVAVAPCAYRDCQIRGYCTHQGGQASAENCHNMLFDQLRFENKMAKEYIGKIRRAQACQIPDLYGQLRANLVAHIKGQQASLYPQLADNPCARQWIMLSTEQHEMVLSQLCALDQTAPNDDLWKMRFNNLGELVGRSVFIEEDKVYKNASAALDTGQCMALCEMYNGQRREVMAGLPAYNMVTTTSFMPISCFSGQAQQPTSMSTQMNGTNAPTSNNQ